MKLMYLGISHNEGAVFWGSKQLFKKITLKFLLKFINTASNSQFYRLACSTITWFLSKPIFHCICSYFEMMRLKFAKPNESGAP